MSNLQVLFYSNYAGKLHRFPNLYQVQFEMLLVYY